MATLEIEFNCMCVFVAAPDEAIMHVLMPSTCNHAHHGHGDHGHGEGVERHVVRILHPKFPPEGISMEGWALDLGGESGASADLTLQPMERIGAETIVNLTELSGGETISPSLLAKAGHPAINARVTLRSGRLMSAPAEVKWNFKGEPVEMSYRATWRMEVAPDTPLKWSNIGATDPAPVASLADLGADAQDGVYRFKIYHVPSRALPPDDAGVGSLELEEVKDHFRALYVLVGVDEPGEDLLPQPPEGAWGVAHCGIASGALGPDPAL